MTNSDLLIQFEPKEQYLISRISGDSNNIEHYVRACQSVYDECQRLGYTKLLWIESMSDQLSTFEIEKLMDKNVVIGFNTIKVAIVDAVDDQLFYNSFA